MHGKDISMASWQTVNLFLNGEVMASRFLDYKAQMLHAIMRTATSTVRDNELHAQSANLFSYTRGMECC